MTRTEFFAIDNVLIVHDIRSGSLDAFTYDRTETAELHLAVLEAENASAQ